MTRWSICPSLSVDFRSGPRPWSRAPAAPGDLHRLAALEGVEVSDDDLRSLEIAQHVARHEFPALVVAVRVVGLEDAKPVFDGDAGGDDQEAPCEASAAGAAHRIDRLPRDDHGHDRGLAGAGGELQREPAQVGVRLIVGLAEVLHKLPSGAEIGRDFGQPDHRLHRLDLAEERADVVEPVVAPMVQQPSRFRRYAPLTEVCQRPPAVDGVAHAVDRLRQLVLLVLGRDSLCLLVEPQRLLTLSGFALLRLGDRRDERDLAPSIEDAVGGLTALVKLPVPRRILIG